MDELRHGMDEQPDEREAHEPVVDTTPAVQPSYPSSPPLPAPASSEPEPEPDPAPESNSDSEPAADTIARGPSEEEQRRRRSTLGRSSDGAPNPSRPSRSRPR